MNSCYTKAFNTGNMPCIENAWHYVRESECKRGIDNAIMEYSNQFQQKLQNIELSSPEEIKNIHKVIKIQALRQFKNSAIGEKEVVQQFEELLKKSLQTKFSQIKEKVEDTMRVKKIDT